MGDAGDDSGIPHATLLVEFAEAEAADGTISRDSVTNALTALKYDGLLGTVYQP